jgi:hypothetical protein
MHPSSKRTAFYLKHCFSFLHFRRNKICAPSNSRHHILNPVYTAGTAVEGETGEQKVIIYGNNVRRKQIAGETESLNSF